MWTEIFTLPFFIILIIIGFVNLRVKGCRKDIKELKKELEQTKKWLVNELYKEIKIEKGELEND